MSKETQILLHCKQPTIKLTQIMSKEPQILFLCKQPANSDNKDYVKRDTNPVTLQTAYN